MITQTVAAWTRFVADLRIEDTPQNSALAVTLAQSGWVTVADGHVELSFDADEWRAFVDGARAGEFDHPLAGHVATS